MNDNRKTKSQLIQELEDLRRKFAELEQSDTQGKETEKIQADNGEHFRILFEQAPLGYQSLNEEGYLIIVNQSWLDLLGYKRHEVIGSWFGDFLAPHEVEGFKQRFPGFKKNGVVHVDIEMVRRDGSIIAVHIDGRISYDEQGRFKQTHCILNDITERKHFEDALRKSELRYRTVADFAYSWEYWLGLDQKFIYCSPSCQRISGYPPEDFLKDPELLYKIIHPEDRGIMIRHIHSLSKKGEVLPIDFRIIDRTGLEHWIGHVCRPVSDAEGKPLGIRASNRDITETKRMEIALRETEERLTAAIEQSNDGISFIKGGVIFYVNKKFLEIFGYDDLKEVVGKPTAITVHPDEREMVSRYAALREAGDPVPERYIFKGLRKNGEILYIEVSVNRITVSGATISMAILRDITANKKAFEQIEASLQEKQVLLKEIHHRVKNNLQVITSLLNLQIHEVRDEKLTSRLRESQNRIKSMALVHEKLYQSADLSRIDLKDYLKSLSAMLFQSYSLSSENIRMEVRSNDILLEGDKAIPCGLIINELVSNAFKHGFPDNRKGEIRVELSGIEDQYILEVRDNGIGIPESLDMKHSDSLGLKIVQTLVEQLEGRLEVNRQGGTSFLIHFPK